MYFLYTVYEYTINIRTSLEYKFFFFVFESIDEIVNEMKVNEIIVNYFMIAGTLLNKYILKNVCMDLI